MHNLYAMLLAVLGSLYLSSTAACVKARWDLEREQATRNSTALTSKPKSGSAHLHIHLFSSAQVGQWCTQQALMQANPSAYTPRWWSHKTSLTLNLEHGSSMLLKKALNRSSTNHPRHCQLHPHLWWLKGLSWTYTYPQCLYMWIPSPWTDHS